MRKGGGVAAIAPAAFLGRIPPKAPKPPSSTLTFLGGGCMMLKGHQSSPDGGVSWGKRKEKGREEGPAQQACVFERRAGGRGRGRGLAPEGAGRAGGRQEDPVTGESEGKEEPGRPGAPAARGVCARRRRRPRGGGGQELGRKGSRLAERLRRSSCAFRPPARRRLALLADSGSLGPNSGGPALTGPNAPAQRGEVEGGATLSAPAPPLGPREFPAPPRGAAPHSGGGGDRSGPSWVAEGERGRGVGLGFVAGTGGN